MKDCIAISILSFCLGFLLSFVIIQNLMQEYILIVRVVFLLVAVVIGYSLRYYSEKIMR